MLQHNQYVKRRVIGQLNVNPFLDKFVEVKVIIRKIIVIIIITETKIDSSFLCSQFIV